MQRGRKKSAVSGQRGLMRAPLMGDFFASWITFWFALPGAQDSRLFRNSARFGAARRRLLLPAHMGRHILYINALIAVVCSIFFAATLLTVLPGVCFPRTGTCNVSGGVTLDS